MGHMAVRTWCFLWELVATGTRDSEELTLLWNQGQKRGGGPLFAARQQLALCGIEGGIHQWTRRDAAGRPHELLWPMRHPVCVWRAWLLKGLAQKSVEAAGKRRPHVGMMGVDME